MRRRSRTLYYPARRRQTPGSPAADSARGSALNRVGVVVVIMVLALTAGLIVGMKAGLIGGGPLNLSAGDPSASPAPAPAKSTAPSRPATRPPAAATRDPVPDDFVDIRRVNTKVRTPKPGKDASTGTFVSRCGTNLNDHNNTDDFVRAPGVENGADALQDYVGNLSTNASSTDESLAAAGTTCRLDDRSTYYWPVLRVPGAAGNRGTSAENVGQVLRPSSVILQFRGSPRGDVVAMPRFLRIITGNPKAATQNGADARAAWSCLGFTDRVTTKYPLCPRGSRVVRTLDFPSCWDGRNTDSADHRSHVVFPDAAGACPDGTRAIPQLRMRLIYKVPPGPSFAVDTARGQQHNPITDHASFENVMPTRLMNSVVSCINRGRDC
ncbi:MAG TPA: DUF1996 domain-containing protein [Streptosporangiaceae bacterium]|nr:DUF1996 domain-containing protein [Streptosporangiaceae bacterium]